MTTITKQPTILRRADLDWRDRAIVTAVARSDIPPSHRELMGPTGLRTVSTVGYRIHGRGSHKGLVERGWLYGVHSEGQGAGPARQLVPGPRFGGLDRDGWPLELVEVAE